MQFPLLAFGLIILGIIGTLQGSNSATSVDAASVIIDTPSGGLVRNTKDVQQRSTDTTQDAASAAAVSGSIHTVEPIESTVQFPPLVETLAAQNIEQHSALLRGTLTFIGFEHKGRLFFIYSTEQQTLRTAPAEANRLRISNRAQRTGQYTARFTGLEAGTTYHYRLCFEDEVLTCGRVAQFQTVEDVTTSGRYRAPSVSVRRAYDIQASEATVRATYRKNDGELLTAFLVYGDDRTMVRAVESTYATYNSVEEAGDRLQKQRVSRTLSSTGEWVRTIDELDESTTYYYTFCVAYDDDRAAGITCGAVRSFETKDRDRDLPVFDRMTAKVSGTSVRLQSRVFMRDYLNGHVFVIYGNNSDRVASVAQMSTFERIRQREDELQKRSLEFDVDGSMSFKLTVHDVALGEQFFRFCVEHEIENDNGRDVRTLTCSSVENFLIE